MANTDNILADSIRHIPHLAAWDDAFSKMFSDKDGSKLLVYLLDSVDTSALDDLAWQYDVTGNNGYNLATTDDQKRAIIKNALNLHRYKGTVWSLKNALISIGYGDAVIVEGDEESWANFSLTVDLGGRALNALEITNVTNMINLYKPKRSILVGIIYKTSFDDALSADDLFDLNPSDDTVETVYVGQGKLRDGTYNHDGSIDRSSDSDSLIWQILPA